MAATLVVEDGSGLTTSNVYVGLADAETIIDERLHVSDWTAATDDSKNRALIMGARVLDQQANWKGYKADEEQAMEWPRYEVEDRNGWIIDSDTIPQWLKIANVEMALFLLDRDRTADPDTLGFSRIKVDVIELEMAPGDRPQILPTSVQSIIAPYIKSSSRMGRVMRG